MSNNGFKTYTASEIFVADKISTQDVLDIADAIPELSGKTRFSENDRTQIKQFAQIAKDNGMTIKQAIASLSSTQTTQQNSGTEQPSNPEVAPEFNFDGVDQQALALTAQAHTQLALQQQESIYLSGVMQRVQEEAIKAEGYNHMEALLAGTVQPQSDAEKVLTDYAKEVGGYNRSPLPSFVSFNEGRFRINVSLRAGGVKICPQSAINRIAAQQQQRQLTAGDE